MSGPRRSSRSLEERHAARADRVAQPDVLPRGVSVHHPAECTYPAALRVLPDPPARLFALGSLDTLAEPVVAIVGTRQATPYGERVTREIAGALARAGACIASGLARGIDAAAHRAALAAGGRTVAVLGTGIDVPYPACHRALHGEIARRGLLLSEWPPGTPARRGCFPRRNRIIAALARSTIVIEAGLSSGALITARLANDLSRDVAAIPGPIDAPTSAGTNLLLRDGAIVIAEVADALSLVGLAPPPAPARARLEGDELAVWSALAGGGLGPEALVAATALPAGRCFAAVSALELAGVVSCELTGEIRRR